MSIAYILERNHFHIYENENIKINVDEYSVFGEPAHDISIYQIVYYIQELDSRFFIGRVAESGQMR